MGPRMIYLRAMRPCFLAVAVVVLVACKGPGLTGPPGEITLSYDGASDTDFFFMLENRSTQPTLFPATKTLGKGVMPWNTTMVCMPPNHTPLEGINSPPLGYSDRPDRITVSPGGRLRLTIEKEDIVLRFKGGQCHLQLRLPNGAAIESKDFQP